LTSWRLRATTVGNKNCKSLHNFGGGITGNKSLEGAKQDDWKQQIMKWILPTAAPVQNLLSSATQLPENGNLRLAHTNISALIEVRSQTLPYTTLSARESHCAC